VNVPPYAALIAASPPETPPATRGAGSGQMRHGRGCPSLFCRSRQPDGQTVWPARILSCSFQPLHCEIPMFYPPCLSPYRGPEGVNKPVLRSATDAMRGAVGVHRGMAWPASKGCTEVVWLLPSACVTAEPPVGQHAARRLGLCCVAAYAF